MVEIGATIVLTSCSLLLFAYWFRYTCLLILSARTSRDYAADVASANQLSFREIQASLRENSAGDLEAVKASLDRDYKVLTYLLKHAADPATPDELIEKRMLRIHYSLMRVWYGVTRNLAPSAAYKALDEMAAVVAHFANAMGESAASAA
jgi:hypothetical protein